ncbi:hypothetical protein NQ318_022225 [Aromia moschata]|uniref:Calpain inhibitor n=1 Tax=Aromia moschata TaxID=1265417 RepID=A0AAV8XM35_9CUCU|nr:hypothetical protein NQ318_022225 [Aromia moschata]
MEGVKDSAKDEISQMKREVDSLDDFEHLGHDSSPLNEAKASVGDFLGLKNVDQPPAHELKDEINKGVETVGSSFTDSFDPFKSDLLGEPLVPEKMDSNLLQMGDSFPDRKEADAKLEKFLQDFPSAPQPTLAGADKYDIKSFMDNERGFIQGPPTTQSSNDILDRYSDSEPEDDFKPSKYEDFSKKHELPESFGSTENFKSETFKDVDEIQPQLPKKDYPPEKPAASAPEPPKAAPAPVQPAPQKIPEPVKEKTPEPVKKSSELIEEKMPESKPKTPEPVKEKTPEPAREKTPEPAKEKVAAPAKEKTPEPVCKLPEPLKKIEDMIETKSKIAPADAEAIFCKMGLGKS